MNNKNEEINLFELINVIKTERFKIFKLSIIFALIGLIFAVFAPKKFTVTSIMVPQTTSSVASKLGGLTSIVAMAGLDMSNVNPSEGISPLLYTNIVQSLPFQFELLNTSFYYPSSKGKVLLIDYLNNVQKSEVKDILFKYSVGLPSLILKKLRKENIKSEDSISMLFPHLSFDQDEARKKLDENVRLDVNKKEGYLTLFVTLGDPFLAAQVAQKSQELLQSYVTKYKIEKASAQLKFINDRFKEKKIEFEAAQRKLSIFRDQNKYLSTAFAKSEEDQLQSEFNIAFTVYSDLAKQLEQAQIQVKEDTPILTVIDPVKIPIRKSGPNRPMILIIWIFLGSILGVFIALGKRFFSNIN